MPVTQTGCRPRETQGFQPLLAHPPQRMGEPRMARRCRVLARSSFRYSVTLTHQFTSKSSPGGQAYPPAWYGGPGGGEPVARTNHERHATGSPATTTSSPSEATNGSSSRSSVPPPDWEARAGACSWEWWPPDPPPEWALDGAPWEPPGLPAPPQTAGHPPYHPEGERTGAW